MSTSSHSSLGEIVKLEVTDKGYTKMILTVNIPFKAVNITFNVFDSMKLRDEEEIFAVGDCVRADYHYKERFTQLDQITKMIRFDNCPICYCNLEAIDAQRFECPGCALINEDEHKERISEKMELLECNLNVYKFSPGYKVEFLSEDKKRRFATVIFQNSPIFDGMKEMKNHHFYHVVGWWSKQGFKCSPLEIVNIHDIY